MTRIAWRSRRATAIANHIMRAVLSIHLNARHGRRPRGRRRTPVGRGDRRRGAHLAGLENRAGGDDGRPAGGHADGSTSCSGPSQNQYSRSERARGGRAGPLNQAPDARPRRRQAPFRVMMGATMPRSWSRSFHLDREEGGSRRRLPQHDRRSLSTRCGISCSAQATRRSTGILEAVEAGRPRRAGLSA